MAKFNKKIKDTSVRLGEVRFSYTAVFQPKKNDDGTPCASSSRRRTPRP